MPDRILPIIDLAPDLDPITPGAMTDCENLYPTWKGWRTYPSLVKFSDSVGGNVVPVMVCGQELTACGAPIVVPVFHPIFSKAITFGATADLVATSTVPCNDNTERGQQHLEIAMAFQQVGTFPGNLRTSWAYVSPAEEFTSLIGDAGCAGGNMAYYSGCCALNHFEGSILTSNPALVDPNSMLEAVNTVLGTSDEPTYCFASSAARISAYYPGRLIPLHVTFNFSAGSFVPSTFAKGGSSMYVAVPVGSAPSGHILGYDADAGGNFISDWSTLSAYHVSNMNVVGAELIALAGLAAGGEAAIKKLSTVDGSLVQSIDVTGLGANFLFAVNSNLVYLLCTGSPGKIYYWNGSDIIFVGNANGVAFSPFGGSGFFTNGNFYFGGNGFAGFGVNVQKVAVACPSGSLLIASLTRGSASVAAGSPINVTWADILEPHANDKIMLYPEPPAGRINYSPGSALATQSTGGASGGTIAFNIPGGTTPGSYIVRFQTGLGNNLVTTSAAFTVT